MIAGGYKYLSLKERKMIKALLNKKILDLNHLYFILPNAVDLTSTFHYNLAKTCTISYIQRELSQKRRFQ